MKGHLRERSPGKWAIVLDVEDPATGKKKRKWHAFTGTKREAQKECSRLITAISERNYREPSKTTVGEYFDRWLDFVKPHLAPKTHERYADILRKNLAPLIGGKQLVKLDTEAVDTALSKALASGRRDGKGGLAPRTVHHMRRVLSKALNQAITWNLISRNAATTSQAPKVERKKMLAYDASQTMDLVETLRGKRLFAPVLLSVMTGMRRGEVVALRWRDVDFAGKMISVVETAEQTKAGVRYKPPKGGKPRTVAMSASLVEDLRAHRARQAEEQLRLGVRLDADSFVVAQFDGAPLQPRSLSHEWSRIMKASALPYIRFHDLRHTHASQMLAAGVHPKIAQERLGHSTIAITLDLYSHVMPGMQADAAEQVDAALQAAKNGAQKAK